MLVWLAKEKVEQLLSSMSHFSQPLFHRRTKTSLAEELQIAVSRSSHQSKEVSSDYEADKLLALLRPSAKRAKHMGWLFNMLGRMSNEPEWNGDSNNGCKFSKEMWMWINEQSKTSAGDQFPTASFTDYASLKGKSKKNDLPVGLMETLQEPEYLKFFEAFLEDNELDRVTNFLVDVLEYQKVRHEPTKRVAAQEIFKRHIQETSPVCVKLNSKVIQTITHRMEKGELIKELFDEAFDFVYFRCELGDFRRFVQHSSYRDMLPDSVKQKLVEAESEKQNGWINTGNYQSLHVDVISGVDIMAKDSPEKPDSFCVVSVGSRSYKTDLSRSTRIPSWESHFELPVNSTSLFAKITVWNRERGSPKDFLGQIMVYLCDIESPWLPEWYLLTPDEELNEEEEVCGEIHVRFKLSSQPAVENKEALVLDSSTSAVAEFVRSKVSKKKKRFDADGFNLDLSYITEHLIAMGFPSESIEGIYRNNIKDVQRFFKTRHPDHYWIYNLCAERGYPSDRFDDRVTRYGFEDHNPCAWNLLVPICEDVHKFLSQHPQNVVCIHCKAGKGRTGLVISAYLLYSGRCSSADEALTYFGEQRTKNGKGVTIPSQKRYVRYMEYFLKTLRDPSLKLPKHNYVFLKRFILINPPQAVKASSINIKIMTNIFVFSSKRSSVVFSSSQEKEEDVAIFEFRPFCNVPLNGDVKFMLSYGSLFRSEKLFHFWMNTRFLQSNELLLKKSEIDKAVKDTKHQLFSENLRVRLEFEHVDVKLGDANLSDEKDVILDLIGAPSKAFTIGAEGGTRGRGEEEDKEDDDRSINSVYLAVGSTSKKSNPLGKKRNGSAAVRN